MTVRDFGVESAFEDPDEGWFGAVSGPESEHVEPELEPELESEADTDRWYVQDMNRAEPVELENPPRREVTQVHQSPVTESVAATLNVVPTRRNGFVRAAAPTSWESRLSNSGAWEFKATSDGAWHRSRAVMTAVAVLVGVVVVVGIVLVLRGPVADESTPAAPSESAAPRAASRPPSSPPAARSAIPLPPSSPGLPPPPPPPPAAEQVSPPGVTRQYQPSYQAPDEPRKPQTNVTRAPMSATPPPPPSKTNQGHATPGDSRRHGFFG